MFRRWPNYRTLTRRRFAGRFRVRLNVAFVKKRAKRRKLLTQSEDSPPARPFAPRKGQAAYVAGTFDTKARELLFLRDAIAEAGLNVVTVDLSTSQAPASPADIQPAEVARHHRNGASSVFTGDRGSAVTRDGGSVRGVRRNARRSRRAHFRRRIGSDRAGDPGDAKLSRRRAQSDGVDCRLGRRARLCRPGRHLHDLFRHGRLRPQSHFAHRARQCRACFGRHDRPAAPGRARDAARHRPHHVRRHHALRAGGGAGAGGGL